MAEQKENFKAQVEFVLDSLKQKGHDRGRIEERLGYSANGIDQSLSRGGNLKLLRSIELYRDWLILSNSTSDTQLVPDADKPMEELSDWLNQLQTAAALTQKIIFDKISSGEIVQGQRRSQKSDIPQSTRRAQRPSAEGK